MGKADEARDAPRPRDSVLAFADGDPGMAAGVFILRAVLGKVMYTLVRRFIKTGIGFLVVGLALGVYMLVRREVWGVWPHPYLVSAHAHVVLVGFVMFLILGVALWLFPRAEKGDGRYRPERIEAAYWILALATALRFVCELARAWSDTSVVGWGIVLGGLGQAGGIVVYFWTMWTRVRPVGSRLREAKGERF